MATKKKTTEEAPKAVAVVQKRELILEGDPEQQLEFAHKAAKALMNWVGQKPNPVMIRGEQYLEFGDWQILGRFYGATVGIEWTKQLALPLKGYEARATVLRNGEVISSAEAMCTRDERNWKDRDEFMLKSMAQTRASAKALRQAFGWVAELAGMKSTPAEEMGSMYEAPKASYTVVRSQESEYEDVKESVPLDWQKPQDRVIIKDLLDANSNDLLVTKKDYEKACNTLTGLPLKEEHFKDIIMALQNYHGEKI